jgi:hypothetical protein
LPNTISLTPSQGPLRQYGTTKHVGGQIGKNNLGEMDDYGNDMKIKNIRHSTLCSKVVTAISATFFCKFVQQTTLPCICAASNYSVTHLTIY